MTAKGSRTGVTASMRWTLGHAADRSPDSITLKSFGREIPEA
jgi:hypothetical protein